MESVIIVEQKKLEDEVDKQKFNPSINYRKGHGMFIKGVFSKKMKDWRSDWNKRLWDCKKVI